MLEKPNNVIRIPTSINGKNNIFKYWLKFLKPYHKLTDREIDVASGFLKQRYLLGKDIANNNLLDKVLMSEDIKRTVREECNISLPHFQVVMGKLRKSKILVDGRINTRLIPNIHEGDDYFQLLLLFDLNQ